MKLSFLIPTVDEEAWIGPSLRALRAGMREIGHRDANFSAEIIVCDGGSSDETVEQARLHGADRVVIAEAGRARQINAGARQAGGDVLVMLHADSLVGPGAIEAIVEAIDAGHVGGWFQVDILPELQTTAASTALGCIAWGINLRTRLFHTATSDQGIFCRREVFEAIGGLPEVSLMEGNLFARALRERGSTAILGRELRISGRRWEKNGLFRTILLMYGIRAAHMAGVDPDKLERVWRRFSR